MVISTADYRDVRDRSNAEDLANDNARQQNELPAAQAAMTALNLVDPITTRQEGYLNDNKLKTAVPVNRSQVVLINEKIISNLAAIEVIKRNQ